MIVRRYVPDGKTVEEAASEQAFVYQPLALSVCFMCGQELHGFPVVQWHGYAREDARGHAYLDVFLHVECAITLGNHLIKDSMVAQQ